MADSPKVTPLNPNGTTRGFLPEKVWQELRGLLDPEGHFFGEFKFIIVDGRLTQTERVSKFRSNVSGNG